MNRLLIFLLAITVSSCASLKLSTGGVHYDPIYGTEVVLEVPNEVDIDTLSYFQFRRKLRTDFNFRYDFAQYAIDQPYSWYMSNFSFNYWRPYNSFDMYWNRFQFWNDWAFNYPFNYGWGWNYGWNNHNYGWYSWNRPYRPWNNWFNGPWSNPGYNVIWNSSRENSIAYINGPRSSRGITNNNISDNIITRYKKGRNSRTIDNSNENSTLNTIVSNLRDKFANVRIYNNPNNVPLNNNNINNNNRPIIINNTKPINNNINSKPTWNSKPSYNSFNSSNSSRGGSVNSNSGGTSRGDKNSVSGGRSGGSSRGGNSNGNN